MRFPWVAIRQRRVGAAVERAQETVARNAPHPQYLEAYRASETAYWSHIPEWIWVDFKRSGATASLDVGCAYGTLMVFTRQVTGCESYGVDFNPDYMSDTLVAEQGLRYAVSNIELDRIPWHAEFDIVILTEVVEHFNFQAAPTLARLAQSLAPDGRMYISLPDAAEWGPNHRYFTNYEDLPHPSADWPGELVDDHVWHFTEEEIRAVVDDAGLDVVRSAHAPGVGARHVNLTLRRRG